MNIEAEAEKTNSTAMTDKIIIRTTYLSQFNTLWFSEESESESEF